MDKYDLNALVDLCVEINPAFMKLYDFVEDLNPYSVIFRYPAETMEPEREEVAEAIRLSEKVLEFTEIRISNRE